MSLVSLVKANNRSQFIKAIEKSVELIGFNFHSNLRKIAVKPNMCYYWDYSTGETTDPKFVAALIDFLRENVSSNLEICVVESDASAMKCRYAFRFLGYEKMAEEKKVKLVNLTEDNNEEIEVKMADRSFTFSVPKTIKNADLLINVPKMKYMMHVKISCALKNIYGCNPYAKKFQYHPYLDEAIVALNKIMKSDLCLVDGIIVRGKYTKKLGLVMASTDLVAIDSAAARIMGLNPKGIDHVVLAERGGVGKINYETVGEKIEHFAQRFPRKNMRDKMWTKIGLLGLSFLKKLGREISFN